MSLMRFGRLSGTVIFLLAAAAVRLPAVVGQDGLRVVGRVVDGATGEPLAGALVTASAAGDRSGVRRVTDTNGRFDLGVGGLREVRIRARHEGYVGGEYGQLSPGAAGVALQVEGRGEVEFVTLRLWRTGVIAGRVFDERGDAVVDAPIVGLRWRVRDGIYDMDVVRPRDNRTDDLGEFRLSNLRPGRYSIAIEATVDDGQRPVFYTIYAPGTPAIASAVSFDLAPGATVDGVLIALNQAGARDINGRAKGLPRDRHRPEAWLLAPSGNDVRSPLPFGRTAIDNAGWFTFREVPPGSYQVRILALPTETAGVPVQSQNGLRVMFPAARSAPGPSAFESMLWGEESVSVDRDNVSVEVNLVPGGRIRGSVVMADEPAVSQRGETFLSITEADGRFSSSRVAPLARVGPDGTFETVGLPVGRYGLAIFDGSGRDVRVNHWVDSVRVHGVTQPGLWLDVGPGGVTDVQVLVATAGVSGGTLRGTVRDEQGRPTGIATVYAFPAERGLWRAGYVDNRRFRAVQPHEVDGSYAVPDLPAGDYHVVALGGGAREGWQHATSLQGFAAIAVQIPVSKGGTLTQPLVVKR